jgi:hypothetical protein
MKYDNVKIYLFFFYLAIPFIFYFPIFLYTALTEYEYISHFYSNVAINSNDSLKILLAHMLSGVIIMSIPDCEGHWLLNREKWSDFVLIFSLLLVILFGTSSHLVYIASILLYISWSRLSPGYFLVIMIPMAVAILILNGQRYFVVWIVLYCTVHTIKLNLLRLLFLSISGLILLATLLQGLKNYGEGLSILNIDNFGALILSIYDNIAPTYLVSYLYLDRTYSTPSILGEIVPFFKLFTTQKGLVDIVSADFLPAELIEEGARLGSSTSMLLSDSSSFLIMLIGMIGLAFRYICRNFGFFNRVIIFYLIIYAPYSVRRSITAFFYDMIAIFFFCVTITYINKNLKFIKSRERFITPLTPKD